MNISRQQGWEYLKQMELRLRVPRPQHQEVDLEVQEEWKKKLAEKVIVFQRCRRLLSQQELIRGLTFYHWFPEIKAA